MSDQSQTQTQSQNPSDSVSESTDQSLSDEIKSQAENLDRGPADMPVDAARNSIGRWKRNLDNVAVDGIDDVKQHLDRLLDGLDADDPDGHAIGQTMCDLAGCTRTVAGNAPGGVRQALETLAASLDKGGRGLRGE